VFELTPSEYPCRPTKSRLPAWRQQGRTVNPQQQYPVTWPAHPVVARAYMDQLARTNTLPEAARSRLNAALDAATPLVDGNRKSPAVAKDLRAAATALDASSAGQNAQRITALRDTLTRIADSIG
jgi:hypothetical protein